MSGYLQLTDGRVVPVHDGIVIGRVAGCDCVIDDPKASRRHARVVVEAGVVEIEDLDSSNGTLLNGKPVTRRLLRAGDQVQIGKTVLTYAEGVPPGTAPEARGARATAAPTVMHDDNDLFGSDVPTAPSPPAPAAAPRPATAAAAPVAAPPPTSVPRPTSIQPPVQPPAQPTSEVLAAKAPPPPLPVAPRQGVVEFADEVVAVRKAPVDTRPAASMPAAGAPIVASGARVLQFTKHAGGGGLLGDDLTQMSGAMRSLLYAGVLLLGAGIVYGIVVLVR